LNALIPILTRAGMRAVFRADSEGLSATVSHIAFGDQAYAPTGTETALHNERVRVPIAGGNWVGDFMIHITALLDSGPSFWIRELGIFLDDGTLLAVWSDPTTPLAYKTSGVPIVTAFDLAVEQFPKTALTVQAGDVDLTLFFGSEFAQLGTSIVSNMNRIEALRVAVALLQDSDHRVDTLIADIDALRLELQNVRVAIAAL
jgi:hypothetical protein